MSKRKALGLAILSGIWAGASAAQTAPEDISSAEREVVRQKVRGGLEALDPKVAVQVKKLVAADGAPADQFGFSVAISGGTVVVGAWQDDDAGTGSGSAYVFERDLGGANTWGQVKKLTAADAVAGDLFGFSVAISGDTAVVGAWQDGDFGASYIGSAYVFERDWGGTDNWGQVRKLTAADALFFGFSVAISGDTVVVGAPLNEGSAYVFERDSGGANNWGQVRTLTAADAGPFGQFGFSVAISGDTVVVGDVGAMAFNSGSAYVFERDAGGIWVQVRKLTAADAAVLDEFGHSVAIAGDTVIVGARLDDDGEDNSGSAYVFERDSGGFDNWGQVKKLTAADAAAGDQLGESVAIGGDTVAVGALLDDDGGPASGSAYVFERNSGGADNWGQVEKLTAAAAAVLDRFGDSVAIAGDTLTVGASGGVGSAYVFEVPSPIDLAVTLSESSEPVIAGTGAGNLSYTVEVTNNGPSAATGVVLSVDLTLPAGVSMDEITPSGATTFTPTAAPDGTWTVGSLAFGASETLTMELTVGAAAPGTDVVSVTAAVTALDGIDEVSGNDSASESTSITRLADLAVSKTDGVTSAVPGQTLTYTIVAANNGPSDVPSALVADVFPSALTCRWMSVAAGGASGPSSSSGNLSDVLAMPAGSTVTYTVDCTIDPAATGALTNTATISSAVPDPAPGNDNATDGDTVLSPTADLTITKSAGTDPAIAGTELTYTLTVTNGGPSTATGVTLRDALPAEVRFVDAAPLCTAAAGTVTCWIGTLTVGETATRTITVAVDPGAAGTLTNTATVESDEGDSGTAGTVTAVGAAADLTLTNTVDAATAEPGQSLTYTLVASNRGPSDVPAASLRDRFPESLDCAWTSSVAGGATGHAPGSGSELSPTLAMPAGSSVTYVVTCTLAPEARDTIVNTASLTAEVSDPAADNNTATATTELVPVADLVLSLRDSADPVTAGSELTYTVTVTNRGPDAAADVTVRSTLQAAVEPLATPGCAGDGAGVTVCSLGTLGPGDAASYELTARVGANVAGTLRHTARAESGTFEGRPGDESATETTVVAGDADLGVTIEGPETAVAGDTIRYVVTLTNSGPADVAGAAVAGAFPAALQDVSWSCAACAGTSCPFDLAAGDPLTCEVTATVAPTASGRLTSRVALSLAAGLSDPRPDNDLDETSAELAATADLSASFCAAPSTAIPGKTLTQSVCTDNAGPSAAPEVTLTMSADFPFADVSCADGTGAPCPKSAGLAEIMEVFSLPAGTGRTYTVSGVVPEGAEVLSSHAEVELPPGLGDPDPSSNAVDLVVTVVSGDAAPLADPILLSDGGGPDLSFDAADEALVVYEQDLESGETRIAGLRLDALGQPLDDEPIPLSGLGSSPAVAFDPLFEDEEGLAEGLAGGLAPKAASGAWLYVWEDEESDPSAILGRVFRGDRPRGRELEVGRRATDQVHPASTSRPQGGFLAVWESTSEAGTDETGSDDNESGIFGRSFDRRGRPEFEEFRINSALVPDPQRPAIAGDGGDGFLVTWDSPRPAGGPRRRIVAQRLRTDGTPRGREIPLTSGRGSQTDPDLVLDPARGRFLVVWAQATNATTGGIGGRLFSRAGKPVSEPFLIGRPGDANPDVDVAPDGNVFVVTWVRPFGSGTRLAQVVDRRERPQGREQRVESGKQGRQADGAAAEGPRSVVAFAPRGADPLGGDVFFVIWEEEADDERRELFNQRFVLVADLVLTAVDDPDPVLPGDDEMTYAVTVRNLSATDAAGVGVTYQLAEGLTLVASTGCAEDPAAFATCTLGTVPGSGTRSFVLDVAIAPGISGTLPLAATVSSSTRDPDESDNTVSEPTHFGEADLEVELRGTVEAGVRVLWEATVKNAGPSRAAGAVLRAELPPGVVPVAWSGCENDPRGAARCLLGELAADEERLVVLTVEAAPELAGTAMTQTVDTFSSTLDPDPDDNAASATVRLGSPEVAELGLELAAPASVTAGGAFTLTARVTNRGAAPAADVVLTAALHAGLELLESRGCREDPGGLSRCTLGLLGVGALEEAHFDFAVDEGSSGPLRIEVRALSPSVSERPESSADVVAHEPDVLPLLGGRFAVRVDWHDSQGQSGSGRAVPFSDNTGFFWFFGPRNLELVATLLDGGAFNGHFWFFYAGLTSHGYDITVTDLVSGIERTYRHPAGELCGGSDTTAFPDADGSSRLAPASPLVATNKGGEEDDGCAPGPTRLCLTEDRFRVEVAWRVPATGEEGRGRAVPGTEDTGFFWFFNPRALDLAVKVLDGRAVNGRFWVFSGGLSHVEHEITVTDTLSGETRSYFNAPGEVCGVADTEAF